jgi:tight adherence protein B
MVSTLVLGGIFFGISATAFFTFLSVWESINRRATARVTSLGDQLDRAGIRMGAQEIVLTVAGGVAILWIAAVIAIKPPLMTALLLLPAFAGAGAVAFYAFVQFRIRSRLNTFVDQLEVALRLMASSIRVGLGLRQALPQVADESSDPAQHEFRRVIGQTNIGASIFDALDSMAERMPCNETLMLARVMRVQSETGADLARTLEQLADTIKGRRQVHRKVNAVTAEGRMSAWVLLLIPVGLGLFILGTQDQMAHALLYTGIGHIVLLIVATLEALGFLWVKAILRVDV